MSSFQNQSRSIFIFLILLFAAPVVAHSNSSKPSVDQNKWQNQLQENKKSNSKLEASQIFVAYKQVKTMAAEFSQVQKNFLLGTSQTSEGNIKFSHPHSFLWQTKTPEASLIVSNGIKVWIYKPGFNPDDAGQLTIQSAKSIDARIAIELILGGAKIRHLFTYKQSGPASYILTPKKPTAGIASAEVFLENKTNLVYKVALKLTNRNETEITLKNVTLNQKFTQKEFEFITPPNTEVSEAL